MVIVKDLSRLTRDKNKTGYYTEIFFPDNDVRFISVNDYIDSGERYEIDDTIMLRGIVNQSYLQDVSKKIKSVIKDMKQQGKYVQNYTPYGYKKSEDDKYKIEVDENVASNVKLIFNMYLQGYSQGQIAKELTKRKIDTPKKYKGQNVAINEWRNDSISRILKYPTYTGVMILNKYETDYLTKKTKKIPREEWILKENTHEAIIDKETFEEVQKMLKDKFYKPRRRYEYLLKDLVYCGHCKSRMQYKSRTRTKVHNKKIENPEACWYYKCRMLYKFPSICDKGHTISEKSLNEIVIHSLNKRLKDIKIDEGTNKIINEYRKNDMNYSLLLKNKYLKQKIENNIKNLYNQKLEQSIDLNVFREKYKELKQKEKEIELEIEKLDEKNKNRLSDENLLRILKDFKSAKNFDNKIMKMLIEKIEVYEDKTVNIIFKF
jgi:DNA invertase Pin-like site-specific DNA recombinase